MNVAVFIGQANAAGELNASALAAYASNLPNVREVRVLGFRPRLDPQELADEIRREHIERVVIAGDSPGYFKPVFTRAAALAGARPEEVRLASFREHGAGAPNETDRAKAIIACAVAGVPFSLVAIPRETTMNRATLVVGAGIAGIQAALEIADGGNKVYLIERTATIGGHMAMFDKTFPTLDCAAC
ncbi:MAG: FAD-dependent oxidoreductase, partial [Verrucomicrobia bacterium]|nr:FAD-dependent oxidoreductase [Verrucomicrobiota bacterium]